MGIYFSRIFSNSLVYLLAIFGMIVINPSIAYALCNGGVTVTSSLEVSASCDGGNSKGLTLDTGADVIINSGVTVSNDAGYGSKGRAVVVLSSSTSANLVNNGSIYTYNQWGLWTQAGGNVNVVNAGQISGVVRYGISNQGTINSLTNVGSIAGGFGNIGNASATISVFNNLQGLNGVVSTPVSLVGNRPLSYNIIINSPTVYGQLLASGLGSMAFGIYGGAAGFTPISYATNGDGTIASIAPSSVAVGSYSGVLQGVTGSLADGVITGSTFSITGVTGTYDGYNYSLVADLTRSGFWDLVFVLAGPSAIDTQSSLHSLAPKLRGAFSGQSIATNFANMNTYDCNLFDEKGLCVSVGGQQTYVDSPSTNTTSAVVVAGYKVSPTLRIGGFLNQNVNSNTGSSVDLSNNSPLMGLFAVWNQNENHLGYQVKIANAYQDMHVRTTRDVIGTSEAGQGKTSLMTQSYVGELSYAFLTNEDKTLVRPYAAVRYTRIKQAGYSERTTSAVTAPLTYAALSDRSTAALVGVKLNHKLTDKVNLTGSLGVEQDLNHDVDNLTASGVSGLTSEVFNGNINRTRPVASIGAYYMPVKNQRIAADIYYQELPFQSTAATSAYVNYMIGF